MFRERYIQDSFNSDQIIFSSHELHIANEMKAWIR